MKAKEAPEKIYIHEASAPELTEKLPYHIEYVRTDAFIKKACAWFRTLDDKEPPYTNTEEFIEGFKKAMKDE